MLINPGSGKGPPGARHRGQVREVRRSPAAWPGPRNTDSFPKEKHTPPATPCTCLPGASRFRQTPLPASLERVFLDTEPAPFLAGSPSECSLLSDCSFPHRDTVPLQVPDTKMVAVFQARGIQGRGDPLLGRLSQTSAKGLGILWVYPQGIMVSWTIRDLPGEQGEAAEVSCCWWKTFFVFPGPANPSIPAKLSCCRLRFSYLCQGSRDPRNHLQTRRTRSRSRERP